MQAHKKGDDNNASNSDNDSDAGMGFAAIDFAGVDFDAAGTTKTLAAVEDATTGAASQIQAWEENLAFQEFGWTEKEEDVEEEDFSLDHGQVLELGKLLASGKFAEVLRSEAGARLFDATTGTTEQQSVFQLIMDQVKEKTKSANDAIQFEMVGVAALNLFLQANYTGPSLSDTPGGMEAYADINPHPSLSEPLNVSEVVDKDSITVTSKSSKYQNAVLAELAVDGTWPCQVAEVPYFLLLARAIFQGLIKAQPGLFKGLYLWHARALVAHQRLLQLREASVTLAKLTDEAFDQSLALFGASSDNINSISPREATVLLEKGLADHHLERRGKGRKYFVKAQHRSGLAVEVTGAVGKRTKFQQEATAQLLVRARSTAPNLTTGCKTEVVKGQLVEHNEEEILLERVKFDDDKENEVLALNTLDQSIVLALCLDVKNSNPADGLTAEEMGAFLARVLDHHDDWMIYSTGLLERSWLEFERTHARERAILQMQALTDQHTNRLTITQSTQQSIEQSAPVQDRLRNLHQIVYPPRWEIIQDLADRYAALGVVTSAAELYTDVELWDDVVSCYTRAGKKSKAEEIVRERLSIQETPRMWAALGDLTGDPEHYKQAVKLSHGRFSNAYVSLGLHYFGKGDLEAAAENYEAALKVRPLSPMTWFRLGTISMELKRWDTALRAFTEVAQQEPEEGDAWANIAAIHMRSKSPQEAYPALNEALKYQRNSWRIWVSKLYTCLDLGKYDEAIQACNILLDLRAQREVSDGIPPLEEKCVRGIVGGTIQKLRGSLGDEAAMDSARRSLSRVHSLLERINSSGQTEPWVMETLAFLHEQIGNDEKVLEYLMQEYRAFQRVAGWEKDKHLVNKVASIVLHVVSIHKQVGTKEHMTKARFLVRGVVKKIRAVHIEESSVPPEVNKLEQLLAELELQ